MTGSNNFLHPSQLEDYKASFKGSGFSSNEFELTQQKLQPTGKFYDPQAGTVTVRCKITGIQNIYQLSSGNSWPTDFSNGLHNVFFGRKN